MSNNTIVPISPALQVGTRPFWDKEKKCLYYVDVPSSTVHKHNQATGEYSHAKVGDKPIGFMFPVEGSDTTFIASLRLQLVLVEWDGKSQNATVTQVLAEADELGRFNGGKVDPYGRLWAGTMSPTDADGDMIPGLGNLYSYSNGVFKKHASNITISNGLAWNTKTNKMYYIDTAILQVFQYDYNPVSGEISNRIVVFDFEEHNIEGAPDGLTIDSEDKLWVAAIHGYTIVRFDPNTGEVLAKIRLPTPQVTAITFGGENLETIFVTTAQMADANGDKPEDPAGRTFSITGTGVKGVPDVRFQL